MNNNQSAVTTQAEKPNQTSESQQTTKTELAKSISIVFSNDVHCQIDPVSGQSIGYPGVAAYVDKTQDEYGDDKVTLIDAGDAVQGGLAGTFTKGEAIIELMNEVGYDYAIPGNHEFDFGIDQFNWFVENSTATYLSSNFRNLQTDSLCLAPYAIEEYQGIDDGDPDDGDDILIDGHSHETYNTTISNKYGEAVSLVQTGTKLTNIGELIITPSAGDANDIKSIITPASNFTATNAAIQAAVDTINEELQASAGIEIGTSEVDLLAENEETMLYVRWQETNMGDFITDAYRTVLDADVAFINGGGIRGNITAGPITYGDIYTVQPYSNNLSKIEAKGQDILDALEMGAALYPEPNGSFLQVSGISYTINSNVSSSVEVDEHGNFVQVNGPRRVTNVTINGKPLDPNATYTVASINYLLFEQGGGMTMFEDSSILIKDYAIDNQVVVEYLQNYLGGTVGNEYANPEGQNRIVISSETQPEPPIETDNEPLPELPVNEEAKAPTKLAKTSDSSSLAATGLLALLAISSASLVVCTQKTRLRKDGYLPKKTK